MSISFKKTALKLPKIIGINYSTVLKLHAELRERRPRIRATSVYNPRRVRFNYDDADLLIKPHAMTIATYPKRGIVTNIHVKTREDILQEEAAMFSELKLSKRRWRPRSKKITRKDGFYDDLLEMSMSPLDFDKLSSL